MAASTPDGDRAKPGLLARIIGTGCFSGYFPVAPGTFGSAVGGLLLLIPGVWQSAVLVPLAVAGFACGVAAAGSIARYEGDRLTVLAAQAKARFQPGARTHPDPSIVVIDEIVGMWTAVLFLSPSVPSLVIAFLFFRLFDVVKPVPARSAEHLPGGWGIMLDDVVAGVYANIATRVALYVLSLVHVL